MKSGKSIAIYYRREAYQETLTSGTGRVAGRVQGLMGREVASASFLGALLRHGCWSRLDVLYENEADRPVITSTCQEILRSSRTRRHVHLTPVRELSAWLSAPTASVLHFPHPPEDRFAWARQRATSRDAAFAMSGVTHTLCSLAGLDALWRLVTAPWGPYDRLICTSRAVRQMVEQVMDVMRDYLAARGFGSPPVPMGFESQPGWRAELTATGWGGSGNAIGLETLPLGVDLTTHAVPTPAARLEVRHKLGIGESHLALLFVGRLSHHAKAQPYPMFVAAQHVAERVGCEVHLVLCGWFSNDTVKEAFARTLRGVAPNVRLVLVDGVDPFWRTRVWDAADIFVSLADSIQETFGLTNVEAMARGLPVVASDWNGYRDTVVDGETGALVPTYMFRDATGDATTRLITREVDYDGFLAEIGQTVTVCTASACQALERLARDPELRRRWGAAGRIRAEKHFDWRHVVASYESMWTTQEHDLMRSATPLRTVSTSPPTGPTPSPAAFQAPSRAAVDFPSSNSPACYPPLDVAFAGYPTEWLDERDPFQKHAAGTTATFDLAGEPLVNHSLPWRGADGELEEVFRSLPAVFDIGSVRSALASSPARTVDPIRVVAWWLKYDRIRVLSRAEPRPPRRVSRSCNPSVTLVTTCMGRLDDLRRTLPGMVAQEGAGVIVVDYSCPQHCGAWVREAFPAVRVVSVPGMSYFDRSDAKNRGVAVARTDWVCLVDADIMLQADFLVRTRPSLSPGCVVRSSAIAEGTGGTFFFQRELFARVGGHDPVFQGWGEEDEDLLDALQYAGARLVSFPAELITHLEHDDTERTRFHERPERQRTHMTNRLYRAAKWDWARLVGRVPDVSLRQRLWQEIDEQVGELVAGRSEIAIDIETGEMNWNPLGVVCRRTLRFRLSR